MKDGAKNAAEVGTENIKQVNVSQKTTENSSKLDLDINVLNDRGKTYTSLMDLYHVSVFTDDTLAKMKKDQEKKLQIENDMLHSIFRNKEIKNVKDEKIMASLFTSQVDATKKMDFVSEESSYTAYYAAGGVLITIIFVVLLFRYLHIRKKKRQEYVEEKRYE